jgi:AraC-like DNA-binding protein
MRQSVQTAYDPPPGHSVATLAYEYPSRWKVPEHAHGSDQVIYATRGVMEITTEEGFWMIPPQFAVWIPAGTVHSIRMPAAVSMRTLYMKRGLVPRMPDRCAALHVAPLLRELIVEAVRMGKLRARDKHHAAMKDLIADQLQRASSIPTSLVMPKDRRALAVAEATLREPQRSRSLESVCRRAGASARTIERIFLREVGTDFETWRRQARLMRAVELLVSGRSVKETAFAVGYRQPSAFVAMFRKAFGTTPKAWVSALAEVE